VLYGPTSHVVAIQECVEVSATVHPGNKDWPNP
jgi:hypothetical protein